MWLLKVRKLAKTAGREALILFFAAGHPATPTALRIASGAALVYLLSPVDLLPDVPLFGLVDDLLLLSLGVPYLVRKLPPQVLIEVSARADRLLATMGIGPDTVSAESRARRTAKTAHAQEPASRRHRAKPADVVDAKIVSEHPGTPAKRLAKPKPTVPRKRRAPA